MSRSKDFRIRAISAAILAPTVLALTIVGGAPFVVLILATALIGVREWVRFTLPVPRSDLGTTTRARQWTLEFSYAFVIAAILVCWAAGAGPALWLIAALGVVLFLGLMRLRGADRLLVALGVPYLGIACIALLSLRGQPDQGLLLTLWLVLSVWATDTGGYVAGRAVGGPKLMPRVSPNKTWAGLVGAATAAGTISAIVVVGVFHGEAAIGFLIGAATGVVAQGGDLFESWLKRRHGIKDSGELIPGHGGLLDRIDGLVAAAPVFSLFQVTFGKALPWL